VLRRDSGLQDVPPEELWEGYATDAQAYLESGRRDVATMLEILAKHGAGHFSRVLDLGCAAGRMLRHLPRDSAAQYWGADISAPHIRWCQENLPGLNFAATTTAPHLPFEDGAFDFVYAASVFTHIGELADAWLLEVRRVLRPGGSAYLTVHDLKSYELILTRYAAHPLFAGLGRSAAAFEEQYRLLGAKIDAFSFGADPDSQVFYDPQYLTAKWGPWMDVLAYVPQAHDHQSAILLQKRTFAASVSDAEQ